MIRFRTDAERGVRIATFYGSVDDAELLGAYRAQLADLDYDASLDDLVDLRAVQRLDLGGAALRELMAMFSRVDSLGYTTRLAIVAPHDLGYGLGRMYEMMRTGAPEEVGVFRDVDDALAWLGTEVRDLPAAEERSAA
jgi:hypothetical protein